MVTFPHSPTLLPFSSARSNFLPFITPFFIIWSSYSSSGIFASVLHLNEQRFLVGYPLMLLYTAFAVIGIFGEDAKAVVAS